MFMPFRACFTFSDNLQVVSYPTVSSGAKGMVISSIGTGNLQLVSNLQRTAFTAPPYATIHPVPVM